MQRVIIVDFANFRDGRPGHLRGRRVREDGTPKTFAYADWDYITSGINHLHIAAPHSAIYLVSERSMQYEFKPGQDAANRLNDAVDLPCDEFWHMYMMRTRKEQADLRGDHDTRSSKGVRADNLILHLAAELDGFVLSSDFFRQPEYQDLLKQIDHRVYYPTPSLDSSRWHFADSRLVAGLSYVDRFTKIAGLPSLQDRITEAPELSDKRIREIQNEICGRGGLIETFWSDYAARHAVLPTQRTRKITRRPRSQKPTPSLKPGLVGTPFRGLGELVGVLPPTNDGIDENAKLPLVLAVQTTQLRDLIGKGVIVVGRVRVEGATQFLEWYPGDRRIQLLVKSSSLGSPLSGFVGLKGRLQSRDHQLQLDISNSALVQTLSFAEASSLLLDDITEFPARPPRRWSLPRLPRRSTSMRVPRPRPTVPPPGRAEVIKVPILPPDPIDAIKFPEPSRLNPRLVTSIALAAAIVAALAGLVRSLIG